MCVEGGEIFRRLKRVGKWFKTKSDKGGGGRKCLKKLRRHICMVPYVTDKGILVVLVSIYIQIL